MPIATLSPLTFFASIENQIFNLLNAMQSNSGLVVGSLLVVWSLVCLISGSFTFTFFWKRWELSRTRNHIAYWTILVSTLLLGSMGICTAFE